MTQIVQAIYEHGVFRPLQPVELPENERVVLAVSDALHAAANASEIIASTDAKVAIEHQRQALLNMRAQMSALPEQAPEDGLGGADHDQILYGWPK